MRQNLPNIALFVALSAALLAGGYYVEQAFFPKPPAPVPNPPRETVQAVAGAAVAVTSPANTWPPTTRVVEPPKPAESAKPVAAPPVAVTPPPAGPVKLVELGDDTFFQRVMLSDVGAAVRQVVLTRFEEANRLGREVKNADGSPRPLHLIPGTPRPRDKATLVEDNGGLYPELKPGDAPPGRLAAPSYVLLHYVSDDDPARPASDAAERLNDKYPSAELGDRAWTLAKLTKPPGQPQSAVYETTLGAPYFLKLRKTFTLSPGDYHVGFTVDVEALPGRQRKQGKFRYQIAGPRGLPVEGEWYAQTYRNVFVGKVGDRGAARRDIQDAAAIQTSAGGYEVPKGADLSFAYAAVGTQYFASALAVDETQPRAVRDTMWEYVRPTREAKLDPAATQPFLADVTFRAVCQPIDLAEGESKTHQYLIYNGPLKVRLLKQVVGRANANNPEPDPAAPELVDRYLDNLTLKTLTDYQSPNVFGRIAAAVYWSDVVITFTNIMHGLLGFLHRYVPVWGVDIILLTVMVRLLLALPSRKQQQAMATMQAKQLAMKPELDKLAEKYKDDPTTLQQEKTKLMFKHGINPLSALGGCGLLFLQMPIFMGLYFCLQESVFFRLEPFLWFSNLAAPDMTTWWTEQIPFLSVPDNLGGTIYLGPFFNVLPMIAVGLIFLQQYISMPPAVDEQTEMQQKMMKFMVVFMAVFFYKVPAGLCVYFICSTSWAIAERKLIKKPTPQLTPAPVSGADGKPAAPPAPTGMMGRMRAKMEEMQRLNDEQTKRQIRNPDRPDRDKDRKKKRRK